MNHKTLCIAQFCAHVTCRRWTLKACRILFAKWTSSPPRTHCDTRAGRSLESRTKRTIRSSTRLSRSSACRSRTWQRRHCLRFCLTTTNTETISWAQQKSRWDWWETKSIKFSLNWVSFPSIKDSELQSVSNDDSSGAGRPIQHGVAFKRLAERSDSYCVVLQHAEAGAVRRHQEVHQSAGDGQKRIFRRVR